jgi:hypothetical protein
MGFYFSFHFFNDQKLLLVFPGTKGIWTQATNVFTLNQAPQLNTNSPTLV